MANFGSIIVVLCLVGYGSVSQVDAASVQSIATQAYLYFYPIITMDITRRQSESDGIRENTFDHYKTFRDDPTIVKTNYDSLYSSGWLDLRDEPILLSLPNTNGRYYLMQIMDMWTDVIGAPGWRTTGTEAIEIAILPPGCSGNSKYKTIHVPTPYVWVVGRTQTIGVDDIPAVNAIQSQYKLEKLYGYNCPHVDTPRLPDSIQNINITFEKTVFLVNNLTAQQFFEYSAYLLSIHGPHITDWSQLEMFQNIGITPGKSFEWSSQPSDLQAALERSIPAGLEIIHAHESSVNLVNGWTADIGNIGVYGNSYKLRAYCAAAALGANQPQDAVYQILVQDVNGNQLDEKNCFFSFPQGQTPPAEVYWSLTMYDRLGFPIPNPINRYAIHSYDDQYGMTYSAVDQSLTIYIQAEQPSDNSLFGNWLPSPASDSFTITMRIYVPLDSITNYQPPPAIPFACV